MELQGLVLKLWVWMNSHIAAFATHIADVSAHHTKYTNAEAVSAVNTADDYVKISGDTMDGVLNIAEIKAKDVNGLKLYEDGGSGIFVKDGGKIGIGTAAPTAPFHIITTLPETATGHHSAMRFDVDITGGNAGTYPNYYAQRFELKTTNASAQLHQVLGVESRIIDDTALYVYDVYGIRARIQYNTGEDRRNVMAGQYCVMLQANGDGNITTLTGLNLDVYSYSGSTGSATTIKMLNINGEQYSGNFTATDYYGIYHGWNYNYSPYASVGHSYFLFSKYGESHLRSGAATEKVLTLRGFTSQTGNLLEWQNVGGTILGAIKSNGRLGVGISTPTALLDVNSDILRLRSPKTPASAGATGNQGDICWDTNFIYVCVATDTWKRTAITTW